VTLLVKHVELLRPNTVMKGDQAQDLRMEESDEAAFSEHRDDGMICVST